jgi:DNA-binding transcriptional MocR family regulator
MTHQKCTYIVAESNLSAKFVNKFQTSTRMFSTALSLAVESSLTTMGLESNNGDAGLLKEVLRTVESDLNARSETVLSGLYS